MGSGCRAPASRPACRTVTGMPRNPSKKTRAHVNKAPLQVRNGPSSHLPSGTGLAAKGPEPRFGEMERERVMNTDLIGTAGFSAKTGCSQSLLCIPLPPALAEQAAEGRPACLARVPNKAGCNQPKPLCPHVQPKAVRFSLSPLSRQAAALRHHSFTSPSTRESRNSIFTS